jgi:hypothetical protein
VGRIRGWHVRARGIRGRWYTFSGSAEGGDDADFIEWRVNKEGRARPFEAQGKRAVALREKTNLDWK